MPDASRAEVPREKVAGYLLNLEHPMGASKARFFRAHGYRPDDPEVLAADLLRLASRDFVEKKSSPFGEKYVIRGETVAPRGTSLRVETVWIREPAARGPRLVTAYPCS